MPTPVATLMVTNPLTPEQRQAAVDAEINRLEEWSMNNDPASLSNILADLTNSDKEVREAAVDATKQFGSTNAIPALKVAANNTDDLQEKIAMLEAANFLTLPGFNLDDASASSPKTPEQIQADRQRRQQIQAHRQAQLQNHTRNQMPPPTPPAADQNSPTAPDN